MEHGNDVHTMIEALREVKDIDHPVVLHVHTTKGLGLDAENARHGVRAGRCEENQTTSPGSCSKRAASASMASAP